MDPSAYREHAEVERAHFWFAARRDMVGDVARGLDLPVGARLVELGSGTGGNITLLSSLGEVTAIEPDDVARRISIERAPAITHVASLAEVTSGFAFDAAFALDVLEHIEDASAALRALGGWMAPDAPLVVTVPAHAWLFGAHDVHLHHVRRYSSALLRRHLEEGGFSVAWIRPMFAPLLPVAAILRAVEAGRDRLRREEPRSRGMSVPPEPLNGALRRLLALERHAPRRLIPFGLSLLALARKRDRR